MIYLYDYSEKNDDLLTIKKKKKIHKCFLKTQFKTSQKIGHGFCNPENFK